MAATFETEDNSVVEFQLGNKQLFLLFVGLLVICAIFFFIGLKVGEDTARSKVPFELGENSAQQGAGADQGSSLSQQSLDIQPRSRPKAGEKQKSQLPTAKANRSKAEKNNRADRAGSGNTKTPNVKSSQPARKDVVSQPVNKPAEKKAAGTNSGTGNYYVQITAQTNRASAEKVRSRLPSTMKSMIEDVVVKGKHFYRVLIGPFATKDKAEESRQVVLSSYKEAFIRRF